MKFILIAITVFSTPALAADAFTCKVDRTIMKSSRCTECVDRRGEDCLQEEEVNCLVPYREFTGVSQSALHPSGAKMFLGENTREAAFIFSQSHSGFSARLSSVKWNVSASQTSTKAIDPYLDRISLSVDTNLSVEGEGNVISLHMECKPE